MRSVAEIRGLGSLARAQGFRPMLFHREHPTGSKWTCGECSRPIGDGYSCADCHNVLCSDCAARTHHVPAGTEAGRVCLLVTETVALVA